ncbi:MAG: acyl-CoA dehydrogenase family protein [Bryobacterales bacterium]|nr:acyl-CoA dehydrogenase family protein [Bryobacterales bacterium]
MKDDCAPALSVLGEEEALFFDAVLEFAGDEIAPHVRAMDEAGQLRTDVIRKLFDFGLMGIEIPEDLGGQGGTFFDAVLAIQALSRVDASVSVVVDVQNTLVANALLRWGSDDQRRRFLPRLSRDTVASYALSEAGSGSDAFAMQARANPADGGWVLNGRKLWITNASEAGLFLVFANADPAAGYRGVTAFVVERESPGLTVGKKEDKLGIRASSTCEVLFDDCFVPSENVLHEPGRGYTVAIETLNEGRIAIGAQMVGIAEGAFGHALQYIQERKQFGQRIADFQGVQFQVAKMATEIEAARLLVWNAARLKDRGEHFVPSAAIAKYHASEMAVRITAECVDLFGGVGFTNDYPVAKFYRDAKIGTIYEGTSNMQLQTIAKALLRL